MWVLRIRNISQKFYGTYGMNVKISSNSGAETICPLNLDVGRMLIR